MYAVFTNAQLAAMVENRVRDKQAMLGIEGVGQSKVDKYGNDFLQLCSEIFTEASVREEDDKPQPPDASNSGS